MEPETNMNDQILKQLQESNHRMKGINNMLIGILIATGITALILVIYYTKVSPSLDRVNKELKRSERDYYDK
jgi:uncharacterized membrane protein YciS (DUF1049 family)